jgi:hypothetical protein
MPGADWPDDLLEVIYADRFGNLMTGQRAAGIDTSTLLEIAGHTVRYARTFGDAADDAPFWYENSSGLIEIAMPNASAAGALGAGPGSKVALTRP